MTSKDATGYPKKPKKKRKKGCGTDTKSELSHTQFFRMSMTTLKTERQKKHENKLFRIKEK